MIFRLGLNTCDCYANIYWKKEKTWKRLEQKTKEQKS